MIKSPQWSTSEHIYNARGIHHHKVQSVTSNVSGTADQLLTTRQITKIKSITPVPSLT